MNNKKNTSVPRNYMIEVRFINFVLSILLFILLTSFIILTNMNNIKHILLKDGIVLCVIIIISFLIDLFLKYIIRNKYKKYEIELSKCDNLSYNMYPVNVKLKELGLTEKQYNKLINFRVTNILICTIFGLLFILFTTNFKSKYIFKDIILTIIIKISLIVIFVIMFDFIFEFLLKKSYKHKHKKIKVKNKNYNIFTKNKRIYYIPIIILIGIIEIMLFIDFNSVDNIITKVVIPLEIINIINFLAIIIIDKVISKYYDLKKIINTDEDIFNKDYKIDEFEKRKNDDEV